MKVVVAAAARADILGIGRYIARDNPERARSFVDELLEKARRIGERPEAWPLVPRYSDRGVRRRVHGAYLIFYRIEAERVVVLHVLHGARDYEALLFPEA